MSRRRYQEGSLFVRRGKRRKVWVARWREKVLGARGTEFIRRSFVLGTLKEIPTRRQARQLLDDRLREINQGHQRPQSVVSFQKFVRSQWEPSILPTLKFSTARGYQHLVNRHLLPAFGDKPLCEIERLHVQQFIIGKMVREGLSWESCRNLRSLLSKMLGTAVDWGYLQLNPARGVKLPPHEYRREPYFLTREQVGKLLAVLDEPIQTLVLTAVLTGMRIGELLALRVRSVDLDRGLIRVREGVYDGHFSTPKTKAAIRDIPIGPVLKAALQEHLGSLGLTSSDALVFASSKGTALRPNNLRRRHLHPACKKAGLPLLGWHAFRHTHATLLGDSGGSLKIAQAQLGHSSSQVTAEVYTHVVPESHRAAVEKLEQSVLGLQLDPNGPKLETVN